MDLSSIEKGLTDYDISKAVDNFIGEEENWRWRHEGEFIIFLNELYEYIKKDKVVDSDMFFYEEEKNPFTSKKEYHNYLYSLGSAICSYYEKYSLPIFNTEIEENLYFNEFCVLLKYKDIFLKIERISGQGTCDVISLYDGDKKNYFVDYEDFIKDNSPSNYEEISNIILNEALEEFKIKFAKQLEALNCDIIITNKK